MGICTTLTWSASRKDVGKARVGLCLHMVVAMLYHLRCSFESIAVFAWKS